MKADGIHPANDPDRECKFFARAIRFFMEKYGYLHDRYPSVQIFNKIVDEIKINRLVHFADEVVFGNQFLH